MSTVSGPMMVSLKKDDILSVEGDIDHDLYFIHKGSLLICVTKGSQLNPVAKLEAKEYFGEISFFDRSPRSATVFALEDTMLVRIPAKELDKQIPQWLFTLSKHVARKIRKVDELIKNKGLKKKKVVGINALSIEEQTRYFQILKKHLEERDKS